MTVLGVDPGLRIAGYGLIEPAPGQRGGTRSPVRVVEAGCLRFNPKWTVSQRLTELDSDFSELLNRLRPDLVAVEMLFAHYKHPLTAVIMAHARGVILLAINKRGIPLLELRPTEIKKSLTGNGHASKEQMQDAVTLALGLPSRPEPPDVADAIAIAMCAAMRQTDLVLPRRNP